MAALRCGSGGGCCSPVAPGRRAGGGVLVGEPADAARPAGRRRTGRGPDGSTGRCRPAPWSAPASVPCLGLGLRGRRPCGLRRADRPDAGEAVLTAAAGPARCGVPAAGTGSRRGARRRLLHRLPAPDGQGRATRRSVPKCPAAPDAASAAPTAAARGAGRPVRLRLAQQLRRDDHGRRDAAEDVRLQPDADVVAPRQLADHGEADAAVLEQLADVDAGRAVEQVVDPLQVLVAHAEAAVLHLDRQPRGTFCARTSTLGRPAR